MAVLLWAGWSNHFHEGIVRKTASGKVQALLVPLRSDNIPVNDLSKKVWEGFSFHHLVQLPFIPNPRLWMDGNLIQVPGFALYDQIIPAPRNEDRRIHGWGRNREIIWDAIKNYRFEVGLYNIRRGLALVNGKEQIAFQTFNFCPFKFNQYPRTFGVDDGFGIQQGCFSGSPSCFSLLPYHPSSYASYHYERPIGPLNGCIPFWCFLAIVLCYGSGALITIHGDRLGLSDRASNIIGLILALSIAPIWFLGRVLCEKEQDENNARRFHSGTIVLQKYLDKLHSCSTVIDMANVLPKDKQIAVIAALTEGSSLRSIERITGIHHDTIVRLAVKVGQGCAALLDSSMRNLPCNRLEIDEIWGFVGKKDRNVREGEDGVGSVWTFCAIDAETKLVPAFKCGNRDAATAKAFVQDIANRMAFRVQISTDGLAAYVPAMEAAFGEFVDYGQIVKTYGHEEVSDNRRYSAPKFVSSEKKDSYRESR